MKLLPGLGLRPLWSVDPIKRAFGLPVESLLSYVRQLFDGSRKHFQVFDWRGVTGLLLQREIQSVIVAECTRETRHPWIRGANDSKKGIKTNNRLS